MNDLVATLGIANMSKSHVSRMSEELDDMVADFKNRPLDPGGYAYLSCHTLTITVREGGRVVTCSVLRATGVNADGYREMLGMHVATVRIQRVMERLLPGSKSPRTYRRIPYHQ